MFGKLRSNLSHRDRDQSSNSPAPPTVTERKQTTRSPLAWVGRKSSRSDTTLFSHRTPNAASVPTAKDEKNRASSKSRKTAGLGLHIIHEPSTKPIADIIFVHGLGGHSYETWSYNHDTNFFWPGRWLPKDSKIGKTRLFTYGYGSKLKGRKNVSTITSFAKSLLFDMRHSRCNREDNLGLGDAPIIFVVHSMGGLVVKKAYLLAQDDDNCDALVHAMSGIVFLSTPHRGSDLAHTLSIFLKLLAQPDRQFVKDLIPNSTLIEDINEQFRHVAKKLSIISFHETRPTFVGTKFAMVVPRDSALLGYDNEDSRPLEGTNHHTVCKFETDDDPSYVILRDVLKELLDKFDKSVLQATGMGASKATEGVRKLYGVTHTPTDGFNFRKRWVGGSCEWILENNAVRGWLADLPGSQLLWYNSPAGSGKSVLSSFVIHHLQRNGYDCQFYFFDYRNQTRQSLVGLLKSLAHQMCSNIPEFAEKVLATVHEARQLDNCDFRTLWQKVFDPLLFNQEFKRPLFWVIDGLDESESPESVVGLLEELLSQSKTTIRVLVTSRRSEELVLLFKKLQRQLKVDVLDAESQTYNAQDIELLVTREIEFIPGDTLFKLRLKRDILQRAKGNFLWVSLVLEELQKCHTERETQRILNQFPEGMTRMYERMELSITTSTGEGRLDLAKELLQWAVCVPRPLTLAELAQAIRKDYDDILDLRRTVRDLCGQFIVVDSANHVTTVHQTARDFLTQESKGAVAINRQIANNTLLVKTLSSLSSSGVRETAFGTREAIQTREDLEAEQPFILYGANSWIYHLSFADPISDRVLDALEKFFRGSCVLDWVFVLATLKEVRTLARAGKALLAFVTDNRRINNSRDPLLHRLPTIELLESWAGDLVRLTAKFNKHLITQPHAIYETIPALCPPTSAIHCQFKTSRLVLSGQSDSWSDVLARFPVSQHEVAMKIVSLGAHLAVLTYGGNVYVWASADFGEVCVLRHGEAVTNMCMNNKGDMLVTYGLTITKVWSLPEGRVHLQAPNPSSGRAMSMVFARNDQQVIAAINDKSVIFLQVTDDGATWNNMDSALLDEQAQSPTTVMNSPSYMAANGSGTQIGVCYRSFPLTVWDLRSAAVVGRCMRPESSLNFPQTWFPVELFAWNSISGHIIGWYKGSALFKWHPLTDEIHEVSASVDELAVSPNGKAFLTSDFEGTIKVWNFASFAVIHQLSSGDLVSGLSFSPDSTSFYDIRGGIITAWQPNCLVRMAEGEDTFSDMTRDDRHSTMIPQVSETNVPQHTVLSVMAASPNGLYYATGNEDGEVHLADVKTASRIELTRFHNSQPINHLAWDPKSGIIAVADLAGEIRVIRMRQRNSRNFGCAAFEHLPAPKFDMEGRAINQLLFDFSSNLLLVASKDIIQTWNIDEGRLIHTETIHCADQRSWLNNPADNSLFIGVGPDDVRIHQWSDLQQVSLLRFSKANFDLSQQHSTFSDVLPSIDLPKSELMPLELNLVARVQKAVLAQDEKHILIHVKEQISLDHVRNRLFVVKTKALEISPVHWDSRRLQCLKIANDVNQGIEFALTILAGERLIFLDRDLWLSSTTLNRESEVSSPTRHFFIPRDWTDVQGLEQCLMLLDGTLLCPQGGNVVTIRTNLGAIGD